MPDESLQIAFEIKTTCDEISRRLLRWHWEKKPGNHSLDSLLQHIAQRQKESPDYYDRLPDLSGKTSWQQLDTTLCMRVLLDPEKDAARPLDLLGNTAHPSSARRACNAVRTVRNEAAHASDRNSCAQAAILFNEAVEALEEGYAGTAFKTAELEQYYRMAEDYLSRCGAGKGQKRRASDEPSTRSSSRSSGSSNSSRSSSSRSNNNRKSTSSRSNSRSNSNRNSSSRNNRNTRSTGRKNTRNKKKDAAPHRAVVIALLIVAALGLIVRALTMGK